MGTPALIELADPTGGQATVRVRVHYDGGESTGAELRAMIARDGYPAVHSMFAEQVSRFWVGLDASLQETPAFLADYPRAWTVTVIAGYGLLFTGCEERERSAEAALFDPTEYDGIVWSVGARGNVAGGYSRT